jgi:CheY-like chemotaxis protein
MEPNSSPSLQPRSPAEPSPVPRPASDTLLLVVEDGSPDQVAAVQLLESNGYRVLRAPDLDVAFDMLHGGTPVDLLLADTGPDGASSGPMVAQRARQAVPAIAVLLTSGEPDPPWHAALRATGVECVAKPYRPEQLVGELRHLLANQQQVNALAKALREARQRKAARERVSGSD